MTIAVESKTEGKAILRDLDELLMTRGLRLNSGKTMVLSAAEAKRFFWADENEFLSQQNLAIKAARGDAALIQAIARRLRRRFDAFRRKQHTGQWDKIYKRYINIFASLKDSYVLPHCRLLILEQPALRAEVWRYLAEIGPSEAAFNSIREYLVSGDALDDASIFQSTRALTLWHVPPGSRMHRRIRNLGRQIGDPKYAERSPFFFVGALWVLAKYGLKKHMLDLVTSNQATWEVSSFLARQVAAIIPKLRQNRDAKVVRRMIEKHKHAAANSVLLSLDEMTSVSAPIPGDLRLYILNGKNATAYSVQRFLICFHVLTSNSIDRAERLHLRAELIHYLTDPLYLRVVNAIRI